MISFFLPYKFPSLNEYIQAERTHRMAGAAMKKEYTNLVAEFLTLKRIQKTDKPIYITFEWYEANAKRDLDNVAFSKKFILDGMVKAKIIVNDNQKYIVGWDETFTINPNKPGVQVSLAEYE